MASASNRVDDRAAEDLRLRALNSYGILDTPAEQAFDDLTALAADVCGVAMSSISFIDAERLWMKSCHGVDMPETPRELSFWPHTSGVGALMEVSDTWLDPRFRGHPMVSGDPHLRFYAGLPLITADGHVLGSLCVMDTVPHKLTPAQRRHLQTLADQVLTQLELRRKVRQFADEVAARMAADAALHQQRHMLDVVLTHTDVLIYAKDLDGRFVMANPAVEQATGAEDGVIGRTVHDFFDGEVADEFRDNDLQIMATGEWQVFSEDLEQPDGSVRTFRSTKFPLCDDAGRVIGMGGVSTDVTELVAARAAHAAAEERWRALVEQSSAAVVIVDANGMPVYVNPEAVTLLGADTAGEILGRPALELVPHGIRSDAQAMLDEVLAGGPTLRGERGILRRLDGEEVAVEFNARAVDHGSGASVQIDVRDVSEIAAAHAALKHSAATDALTGLLNRGAWDARVERLSADPRYQGTELTVAVIDMDNFKAFNDTHGHTAGDALLQRFAAAAAGSIRRDDVLARWGGEEFILALPDTVPEQVERILHRLQRCVPFGRTCSIGYTMRCPGEALTDTVIRADRALYQAKIQGRDQLWML